MRGDHASIIKRIGETTSGLHCTVLVSFFKERCKSIRSSEIKFSRLIPGMGVLPCRGGLNVLGL